MTQTRRRFLCGSGAAALAGTLLARAAAAGDPPIDLEWDDLMPSTGGTTMSRLRRLGVVQHGELSTGFEQDTNAEVTTEFNGALVRIPGYLVPLDYDGTGMTTALLVPYVGACVHVPPPPPNQLIFVSTEKPYDITSMFEPVYVTGLFGTAATSTQLAEIGYALVAEQIEPYDW